MHCWILHMFINYKAEVVCLCVFLAKYNNVPDADVLGGGVCSRTPPTQSPDWYVIGCRVGGEFKAYWSAVVRLSP